MKISQTLQKACQVLRRRVRFTDAGLYLSDGHPGRNDTEAIRKATWLYMETWVVPILDAIERGDTHTLKMFVERERGHDIQPGGRLKEPEAANTPVPEKDGNLRLHLECTSPGDSTASVANYLRAAADLIEHGNKDQACQGMGFYGKWNLTG